MVYRGIFTGASSLAAFEGTGFSAGRIVKNGSAIVPTYHVNDYLCSVRVVTDAAGEVLERNDYSGFGKRLESSTGSLNRYRFSGKEEQSQTVPGWQDFGARMYDPDLARWTTPDPLAYQYPGISPYVYCAYYIKTWIYYLFCRDYDNNDTSVVTGKM
jgi:RHS repeat-associated protein